MSSISMLECKKLCLYRCLAAVALSILTQFLLLTVFLLCVNFHVFHLFNWITETISLMFCWYTWLSIMPLISAVILYGILLGKSHLAVTKYYPSRFKWLLGTTVRKSLFLAIHIIMGFLTAWLYARYLHVDYTSLVYDCYGTDCINAHYLFLMGAGTSAGCYHFFKENLRQEPEVEFPMIQEKCHIKMRSLLYSTLYKSLIKSFLPSLCYALVFWLIGDMGNERIARLLNVEADTSLSSFFSVATSIRLLFYSWILSSQILSNMNLMQRFFSILLSQEMHFPIEKSAIVFHGDKDVTLVEALAMSQVPVIQNLAAYELYKMSLPVSAASRNLIFALSIPGGHPYNWNQLSAQCLALINEFVEELSTSVKNISTMKSSPLYCQSGKPTATEAAERMLLRQYNATFGIRRMVLNESTTSTDDSSVLSMTPTSRRRVSFIVQRINERFESIANKVEQGLNTAFHTIPGLFYMFGEPDGAKTAFLLSNSETIVWLIQGLAGICAVSLLEDKYGVVQSSLPEIIRVLLKLKGELDKLNNVNLNGKKLDRNFITLKNNVKRGLYQIVTVFGDYLRDIFDDPLEVRQLQFYMNYQDL